MGLTRRMIAWKTARGALNCPPGAQCKATALEWFAGQAGFAFSKTLESRHLWKVNIQLARDSLCGGNRLFRRGPCVGRRRASGPFGVVGFLKRS